VLESPGDFIAVFKSNRFATVTQIALRSGPIKNGSKPRTVVHPSESPNLLINSNLRTSKMSNRPAPYQLPKGKPQVSKNPTLTHKHATRSKTTKSSHVNDDTDNPRDDGQALINFGTNDGSSTQGGGMNFLPS
jgi:hypothetical protein